MTKSAMFTYKEIQITDGKKKIYGVARIPEEQAKNPLVIFCHGYGANFEECMELQEYLAEHKIAVYSFDFCGGSKKGRSSGKTTDMTVFTEKEDLRLVIETIKKEPFVDPQQIYLLGESQGGFVSAITAEEIPEEIQGLFLIYPAFSIPNDARTRFIDKDKIPRTNEVLGMKIGKAYFTEVLNYNVFDHIDRFQGPVKIWHGLEDDLVDPSYSRTAASVYKKASLTFMPQEGHGFSLKGDLQVATEIAHCINTIKESV